MDAEQAEDIAREMVRALRGRRSQAALDRRLGFRSAVTQTWESGTRAPATRTFLRLARLAGHDVPAALRAFAPAVGVPADPEAGLGAWLDAQRGSRPVVEVARSTGRGRATVARWLTGETDPRLPDLLVLVDALTDRVLDFVARFVDPATLPSTAATWKRLEGARALAASSPWASAVLLGLGLAGVDGDPEALAARLPLPPEDLARCLDVLRDAGVVAARGRRLVRAARLPTVNTAAPPVRRFWADVARDAAPTGGVSGWNLATVSAVDLARIEEIQRAAFREIRALVAESEPAERLVLLSWTTVPLA